MKTIHVAAAVIEHDEKVLAAKRLQPVEDHYWEFPGGKIEEGETPEAALRREIKEELNIELGSIWPLDCIEYDVDDTHIVLHAFGCHFPCGATITLVAHSEYTWLEYGDLLTLDWLVPDKKLATSVGLAWGELFYTSHGC